MKGLTQLLMKITGSNLHIKYEGVGQTLVTNLVGDPTAAETDPGFEWMLDLEEGMKRFIEWRKTHNDEVKRK